MHTSYFFMVSLFILLSQTAFGKKGYVPAHWLISNEKALERVEDESRLGRVGFSSNAPQKNWVLKEETSEEMSGIRGGMKQIMEGSRTALNKVDNLEGNRWVLTTIRWDLALSVDGLVGMLGLGGSAFSSLRWEPKKE